MIIKNCPCTLAEDCDRYSKTAIKRMFDNGRVSHMLDFSFEEACCMLERENKGRMSVAGVQEKMSAMVRDYRLQLTTPGLTGRYIIKPAPTSTRILHQEDMPANEHLTMQIARQVYRIHTAENALVFFADGEAAYLVKRFDVLADGRKIKQEDFASLQQKTSESHGKHFNYSGDYMAVGLMFPTLVSAWQIEIIRFFKLVLFNYLFANGDAHLKNFTLQQTKNGDYVLSPAYDLLNSSLHVNDDVFALTGGLFAEEYRSERYRKTGLPCRKDFEKFGELIGVSPIQVRKTIDLLTKPQPMVYELTERSFLSAAMKRLYVASYEKRLRILSR